MPLEFPFNTVEEAIDVVYAAYVESQQQQAEAERIRLEQEFQAKIDAFLVKLNVVLPLQVQQGLGLKCEEIDSFMTAVIIYHQRIVWIRYFANTGKWAIGSPSRSLDSFEPEFLLGALLVRLGEIREEERKRK